MAPKANSKANRKIWRKRITENEKKRARNLSETLHVLKECLPEEKWLLDEKMRNKRTTKLQILHLAIAYIKQLTEILEQDEEKTPSLSLALGQDKPDESVSGEADKVENPQCSPRKSEEPN